ncbi:TetR/AcrR family transcriptional regulator [Actinomycetes bacterium KLBMP 9759]
MAPDERRAAIVDATLPLVLRHGAGVSTRQIAEAAGIAEGTIFRVFPDKEAVIQAVTAKAFDPEPTLRELREIDRSLPFRERVTACVVIGQRRLRGVFRLIDALGMTGPPPADDESAAERRRVNEAFLSAVVAVIGEDADQLRVPALEFARNVQLFMFSATHPMISQGRPLAAEEIVSILLDGMRRVPDPTPSTSHHLQMIED